MANVSNDNKTIEAAGGLAEALHQAVITPTPRASRWSTSAKARPAQRRGPGHRPGKLGADGVFHADELLLKCPTRYQNALPPRPPRPGTDS